MGPSWVLLTVTGTALGYLAWARPAFSGVYWAIATDLLHHGTFSIGGELTTDYEPLYPSFLVVCRLLVGSEPFFVQLLQVAFASLCVLVMYRLTFLLTQSSRVAMIGAALYAIDPLLVRQASQHSEALLTTSLLMLFAYLFVRATTTKDAIVAGLVLGLVILTRSMTVPLVLAAAFVCAATQRYRAALAVPVAALVVVFPFVARNHSVNGSFAPTRGGLNLFAGNHPYASSLLPEYDLDLLEPLAYDMVTERVGAARNSAAYE